MLLSGGRQSPGGASLQNAMQPMTNLDVTTYVVSVGVQSDVPVQKPGGEFSVTSYNDLPRHVQRIARSITEPPGK